MIFLRVVKKRRQMNNY